MNPGLEGEVEAHEKGHGEQFTEAINSTLTVGRAFQHKNAKGEVIESTFSGTIDKILDQASAMFDKIKIESPDAVKVVSKEQYLNKIFMSSQIEIFKKMETGKPAEDDANKRANKSRKGNMPYTNGQKTIIL